MTAPHATPVAHSGSRPPSSSLPAALMAVICFALAILVWPRTLEHVVSLQWYIGSMRTAASHLSELLAGFGALSILARRLINDGFRSLFPTPRHLLTSLTLVVASALPPYFRRDAIPVDSQQLRAVGSPHMTPDKSDVLYGTLGLMVIKTLEALGPLHGYRLARRIEQISRNQLALNQGTLYPALLKLEQVGWISSTWGTSESGRRVRIIR